jgi:hypothetical protein
LGPGIVLELYDKINFLATPIPPSCSASTPDYSPILLIMPKEASTRKLCEHEKDKHKCADCRRSKYNCEHGRSKYTCTVCKGSGYVFKMVTFSICEHGRQKARCKDCGGSGLCEHGRQKATCKDCGGNGICDHGKENQFVKAVHYVITEERSADVKNVEAVVCVFTTSKSTAALNVNRSKGKLI